MSTEEEEEWGLASGSKVESAKEVYTVLNLLGAGGFGAVYKVVRDSDKKSFAMKVERKLDDKKHSKLKMEIHILKSIATVRTPSHFTPIVDRGKKETFFFLIMQLVGKSLADLKACRPQRVFSLGTGLGVAIQCLEAVEDLHGMGFVHRDLKPANYACGLDQQAHTGTVAYAPLACHCGEDFAMKDDCESWFYLLLDIMVPNGLPWRRMKEKSDVKEFKSKIRNENSPECDRLFLGLPIKLSADLRRVLVYIIGLRYVDSVDYGFIYKVLRESGRKCNVDIDAPYDWEESKTKCDKK